MIVWKLAEDQALRGAAYPIEIRAYENGSPLIPSVATITVFEPGGNELVKDAVMTINPATGAMTYTLAAIHTAALGEEYMGEPSCTVGGAVHKCLFFFDVVLQKLVANVTDDDLKAYFPQLGDELWAEETGFAGQIEEAFRQIKRLIRDKGRRPALLLDGSQVRELVIIKTFEMIFFNFARTADDIWWARHEKYRALFEKRFEELRIKYDADESGTFGPDETSTFAQPRFER